MEGDAAAAATERARHECLSAGNSDTGNDVHLQDCLPKTSKNLFGKPTNFHASVEIQHLFLLFDLNFAIWNRDVNTNHLPHAWTSSTSLMDKNTWFWPNSTESGSPAFQRQRVQGTDGQKRTDQVELHDTCSASNT
jgi:hypothetical protein